MAAEENSRREPGAVLPSFSSVADAFSAAGPPESPSERALVVAAFLQSTGELEAFTGQWINTMLKDLGHGVSNITAVLESLIQRKPQWVIQLKKSGSSRQARKTYKVTAAGFQRVDELISSGGVDARRGQA
jgi:hypothetical protein